MRKDFYLVYKSNDEMRHTMHVKAKTLQQAIRKVQIMSNDYDHLVLIYNN